MISYSCFEYKICHSKESICLIEIVGKYMAGVLFPQSDQNYMGSQTESLSVTLDI